MGTSERDSPAVELLKSVVWTVQLLVFLVLTLGPVVAGFAAPLGPPQYVATVEDVAPADAAGDGAVAYADLGDRSRAVFDELVAASSDELARQTDAPPTLLTPGERVVVASDHAFTVVAVENRPPLRPLAILGGLIGGAVGALVGAALLGRSPI